MQLLKKILIILHTNALHGKKFRCRGSFTEMQFLKNYVSSSKNLNSFRIRIQTKTNTKTKTRTKTNDQAKAKTNIKKKPPRPVLIHRSRFPLKVKNPDL